ncbi:MAG: YgfZ/GcvT domain-containing protein [Janthinobacterium lividum]
MNTVDFHGIVPLHNRGVIRAEGPDAASFLHGQLTQDFVLLTAGEARLAALCTAKGRMIASFIGIRPTPQTVLLVVSADILAQTLKRLSMFVMRAKLELTDATADYVLRGLAGDAIAANGGDPAASPGMRTAVAPAGFEAAGASIVALYPADGVPRALWIAPAAVPPPTGTPIEPALWAWSEVRSGVATLTLPTVEVFVPQMLNYESVGGVNFKKGCYPGQEIVARSQFRGTLKRRTYVVDADLPVEAGQDVFAGDDTEQPVGTVVQSAASPAGGWSALVSMQVSALETGGLRASSTSGPALRVEPLPYLLRDDI